MGIQMDPIIVDLLKDIDYMKDEIEHLKMLAAYQDISLE
jgi:hypothetical protein